MAKFDDMATNPAKKHGTTTETLGPFEDTEYPIAATGSRTVKVVLRAVCDFQTAAFSNVMLFVRGGWYRARLNQDAFWKGNMRIAPSASERAHNPTSTGGNL